MKTQSNINRNKTFLRIIGDRAEDAVAQYLADCGFRLIARNYNVPGIGELDLVFEKEQVLYITEVKSRRTDGPYPHSEEAVDFKNANAYTGRQRDLCLNGAISDVTSNSWLDA